MYEQVVNVRESRNVIGSNINYYCRLTVLTKITDKYYYSTVKTIDGGGSSLEEVSRVVTRLGGDVDMYFKLLALEGFVSVDESFKKVPPTLIGSVNSIYEAQRKKVEGVAGTLF